MKKIKEKSDNYKYILLYLAAKVLSKYRLKIQELDFGIDPSSSVLTAKIMLFPWY